MDIQIVENMKEILQVVINCRQIDDEIMRLKCHIELFDKKLQAKKDNELHFIAASVFLWMVISCIHASSMPIISKNLYTFCSSALLVPLAYFISNVNRHRLSE